MGRGKENEGETQKLLLSSVVLREDIVNLLDFIERLKNEEDQIVLDTDQIENLKLELTFLSACLQLCYYNSDGSKAKMSCISYEIHDLVQSLFHQSGDDMLVKLKDHVVPCLLENIKTSITSDHHSESSATMTEDQLVELLDALLVNLHYLPKVRAELLWPSMTQYELLQNVFGTLRDFHGLKVNGCIEHEAIEYVLPQIQLMAERVGHFCFALLSYQLKTDEKDEEDEDETDEEDKDETDEEDEDEDETDEEDEDETAEEDEDETDEKDEDQVNSMLVRLLLKIIPVSLEVMQICSTMLEASKSAELGCFIKKLLEASPDILREHLIHLQQHMVNAIPCSTSAFSIHVLIEFLLLFLTDMPQDFIHYEKLFVLLARVGALIREVSILIRNLEENSTDEENMNKISCASRDLLENIELLKEDLKNVFLIVPADSSQLCFPMSDGPLFMTLLLRNLNDLLNSNAYSVALIKDEIGWVKEDLEHIRSFFGNVEQELHRDLWTSILDVAYKAEHAINSILARDHGLLQLIFLLPDAIEKIKLVKKEVQEKISKNTSIIFVDSPNKPVINKSSIAGKIVVGFEEETEWIIRKLTSGPAEVDVISIVGMPGLGKTTLAYKVYNEKSVVGHFDILAWCTVDQERNEKKLLQKIFNQVMGLKERFNEDDIDDDVADKLRKELFGKRYLVVLDDMWDTATWDELTRPLYAIPSEFQKGSRVILTSRKKEVALHGKCHSDPLDLRLLRPEESWELLEKRVFGEESCPDELRDVGEKISQKCDGLPLVLDLISGVMSRKAKKEVLWLEILNNMSSFIFKDEEEVMKVIQLSYDHLSDHLKPCFLYLASYPKDEDIEFSQLKDLWSSEGLVEQTDLKSVEEVTEVFVDELIASSLVIVRGRRKQRCQIHDLVHDFCSIKARTEKLFDLTSSIVLSSSSSSDLRQRSRTLIIDVDPHSNDEDLHSGYTSSLFNPEKRNPYVKHLLSLQLECSYLPPICHVRHLRLLKRLELLCMILRDTFLNEIGMLVHLRCLRIMIQAEALPPSFSNLCNLETLVVVNFRPDLVLSPTIWSLAKLRHVKINSICSVFNSDIDKPTELENLTILDRLKLSCLVDSENIFKRFPNLRTLGFQLDCSVAEQIYFPRLDVLNKLEKVCASFECCWDTRVHQFDFHFPSSLKEVEMDGFNLTSDALSGIGRSLPNLQKLELVGTIIQGGKEWNMEQVTFHNLKSLKLFNVFFSEWQVTADESFPVLEELEIRFCIELVEIPLSFGDIASLKSISLERSPQLKESARNIKKYVEEINGEDKLKVKYQSWT
ncbi:putative late blight resistance protein homolog R1A-3 isoform X2 [Capsicum annuum]|uniref:putative late blight resistance protein homolog R1A-3 isoform X2 n=1 Tax=Capsicum annuum TaxID=4072 RepID=UPI001FB07DD7|nr:putative late blight resistance protein homolog R1A-3 isoform X2 [Capsicum annuum]